MHAVKYKINILSYCHENVAVADAGGGEQGISKGLTGVVTQPITGAHTAGLSGFVKGRLLYTTLLY